MKINAETLRILTKELPWIQNHLPKNCDEFRVEIIDVNTLSLRPRMTHLGEGYSHAHDQILLIDGNGNLIGMVGVKTIRKSERKIFCWPPFQLISKEKEIEFYESVEEALRRIEGSDQVRYLMHIVEYYQIPDVVLHKVPNRIPDLRAWIEQKISEEAHQLHLKLSEK